MSVRRLLLLALLLALPVALSPSVAAASSDPVIGIGEQNPQMFSSPYFRSLQVKNARVITAWDALHHKWQRAELDTYMNAAHAAGVKVLLSFGHARSPKRSVRRHVPSVRTFTKEFVRFKKRYPWVKDWLTWNEANHSASYVPQGSPSRALLQQHPPPLLRLPGGRRRRPGRAEHDGVDPGVQAHGAPGQAHLGTAQLHRRRPRAHVGHP